MLAIERKNEILDKLRAEQRVLVSDLAEYYHVTEETIRRDLDKLEKEGYATKTYGGAILGNSTKTDLSYTIRNKTNVEAKNQIAAIASRLIEDGDHLMLDDSSTSLYLAKKLKEKKGLTVITNSVELVVELSGVEGWTIILTGGRLKPESLALVGDQTQQSLRRYHVAQWEGSRNRRYLQGNRSGIRRYGLLRVPFANKAVHAVLRKKADPDPRQQQIRQSLIHRYRAAGRI